jgi:hypothetical protein
MSANVSILGNLGRAPETRTTPEVTLVANISIASNTVRGRADVVLQDFEFAGSNASRATQDAAETTVSPEQKINREIISPDALEVAKETAEMMAVLQEMDKGSEAFAGQF